MKKMLAILFSLLLLVSAMAGIFTLPVSAMLEGEVKGTTDKNLVDHGETFTLTVSMEKNPGICSWSVDVFYDENALELINQRAGFLFSSISFGPKGNPCSARWNDFVGSNHYETGNLFSLTFRVKENAKIGSSNISIFASDSMNAFWEDVYFVSIGTSVTIQEHTTHQYDNVCDAFCNVCNAFQPDRTHTYTNDCDNICNNCGEIRWAGHSYDNDCDNSCNVCGEIRSTTHCYAPATCTEPSYCVVCGAISGLGLGHYYTNECDTSCNRCDEVRVTEHKYDNACDATCNMCGETRTITHQYTSATCTEPKACTVCGIIFGSELGHTYTDGCDASCNRCDEVRATEHKYDHACDTVCNVCGKTRTITHAYKSATCTKAKTCKVCGATTGKALGHTYSNACDKTCNRCNAKRKVSAHQYSDTYCDEDCDICGAIRTPPHRYSNSCDIDCNLCKDRRKVSHEYDNDCDEYCNICKSYREVPAHVYTHRCDIDCNECYEIRIVAHKYSSKCDNTCNYCGSKRKVSDHTYKSTKVVKATLTKDGYSIKTCGECGKTYGSKTTISKVGHVKLSTTAYSYTGSAKKPTVTVKNSKGKTISSKYYTVTYASGRKNVGKYKVTIKMKGNYSGTKTLYFTINPAKTTVKSLTAGSKKLTVNITKKSTQVTGYQIQYSTSKSFKSYKTKTISSYKTTKTTLTGLKAKKTYYVRVRTYKTVAGKKYYSGWSIIKYKKTK